MNFYPLSMAPPPDHSRKWHSLMLSLAASFANYRFNGHYCWIISLFSVIEYCGKVWLRLGGKWTFSLLIGSFCEVNPKIQNLNALTNDRTHSGHHWIFNCDYDSDWLNSDWIGVFQVFRGDLKLFEELLNNYFF